MTKESKDRIIRLTLVDGSQVNGRVNINRAPGHDRVSDLLLDAKKEFLIVTGATQHGPGLDAPVKREVMFLNKRHIMWAAPEVEEK